MKYISFAVLLAFCIALLPTSVEANWDYMCYSASENYGPYKYAGKRVENGVCNDVYEQKASLNTVHYAHHGGSQACTSNGAVSHWLYGWGGGIHRGTSSNAFYLGGYFVNSAQQSQGYLQSYANEKNVCGSDQYVTFDVNTATQLESQVQRGLIQCQAYTNTGWYGWGQSGADGAKQALAGVVSRYSSVEYQDTGNQICAYALYTIPVTGYRAVCYAGNKRTDLRPREDLTRRGSSTIMNRKNYGLVIGTAVTCK